MSLLQIKLSMGRIMKWEVCVGIWKLTCLTNQQQEADKRISTPHTAEDECRRLYNAQTWLPRGCTRVHVSACAHSRIKTEALRRIFCLFPLSELYKLTDLEKSSYCNIKLTKNLRVFSQLPVISSLLNQSIEKSIRSHAILDFNMMHILITSIHWNLILWKMNKATVYS